METQVEERLPLPFSFRWAQRWATERLEGSSCGEGDREGGEITVETGSRTLGCSGGAAPTRSVGLGHWNLELSFSVASAVSSREKTGLLESSPVESHYAKAAWVAALSSASLSLSK